MSRDDSDRKEKAVGGNQNPEDFQLLITPRPPGNADNKSKVNSGSSLPSEQGKVCFFVLGNLLITLGTNRFLINDNVIGYVLLGAGGVADGIGFTRLARRMERALPIEEDKAYIRNAAIKNVRYVTGVNVGEEKGVAKFLTSVFLNSLAGSNLFFLVGMKGSSIYFGPLLGFGLTRAVKFVVQKWDPVDAKRLHHFNGLIPPAFINFVGSTVALTLTADVQNITGWGIAAGSFMGLVGLQFKYKKDSPLLAIAQLVSMIPMTTLSATAIRALPAWTTGIHPALSIATIATSPAVSVGAAYLATHLISKGVAKWLPQMDPRPHAIFGVGLWRSTATVLMLARIFDTAIHIPHQSDTPVQNAIQAGWSALLYLIIMIAMYTISVGYNAYQNRRSPNETPMKNSEGCCSVLHR